ncbi:MAG: MlaD family protein [Gammaproteobacteria bacterium]|nr:MlaD family protein [Gammaproteobacteria bacterium]
MDTRLNYIFIGLFVLVLGAAFIFGVLWLSTGDLRMNYQRYLVYTSESVSGLSIDSAVRYHGVNVGRVAEIALAPGDPTRVRLELDVREGTPVKADTVASMEMQGLTGLVTINLSGGTAQSPPAPVGPEGLRMIRSEPSDFAQLEEKVSKLLTQLGDAAGKVDALLDESNRASITRTLMHLEQLADHTRAAGEGMPQLVKQLRRSAVAVEQMAKEFNRTGESLRREVEVTGQELRRFTGDTLPEAGAMVEELRRTAANLHSASELIERDPSVLIRGAPVPLAGPGE